MTRQSKILGVGGVLALAAGQALGTQADEHVHVADVSVTPAIRPHQLAGYRDSIPGTLVVFDMVPVPAGRSAIETPAGAEDVAVGPFWMGRTEVTWDEYDVYALRLDTRATGEADATARPSRPYGAPDHGFGHAGYPAISITRQAAEAYCRWLSAKTGRTYRLPTDAEWSHVARLAFDSPAVARDRLDAVAWHGENAAGRTRPVGSKAPDGLGLHDVLGNAAEWVVLPDGSAAVRGGSFRDPPNRVGPAARAQQSGAWNESDPQIPKSQWWLSDGPFVGFRIVRVP
jgi:formylglycine-generating enzyme required for sulfatase activity